MIDEHYDRHYREARSELNQAIIGAISTMGRALGNAFVVLNRIEYSAPWALTGRKAKIQ